MGSGYQSAVSFKEGHDAPQLDFHVGKALAERGFKVFNCIR